MYSKASPSLFIKFDNVLAVLAHYLEPNTALFWRVIETNCKPLWINNRWADYYVTKHTIRFIYDRNYFGSSLFSLYRLPDILTTTDCCMIIPNVLIRSIEQYDIKPHGLRLNDVLITVRSVQWYTTDTTC